MKRGLARWTARSACGCCIGPSPPGAATPSARNASVQVLRTTRACTCPLRPHPQRAHTHAHMHTHSTNATCVRTHATHPSTHLRMHAATHPRTHAHTHPRTHTIRAGIFAARGLPTTLLAGPGHIAAATCAGRGSGETTCPLCRAPIPARPQLNCVLRTVLYRVRYSTELVPSRPSTAGRAAIRT